MASKTKHSNKRVTETAGQINHSCSSTHHVLTRICSRPTPRKEDSGVTPTQNSPALDNYSGAHHFHCRYPLLLLGHFLSWLIPSSTSKVVSWFLLSRHPCLMRTPMSCLSRHFPCLLLPQGQGNSPVRASYIFEAKLNLGFKASSLTKGFLRTFSLETGYESI